MRYTATRINVLETPAFPVNWSTRNGFHDSARPVERNEDTHKINRLVRKRNDLLHGMVGAIEVPSTATNVDGIGAGGYARSCGFLDENCRTRCHWGA